MVDTYWRECELADGEADLTLWTPDQEGPIYVRRVPAGAPLIEDVDELRTLVVDTLIEVMAARALTRPNWSEGFCPVAADAVVSRLLAAAGKGEGWAAA